MEGLIQLVADSFIRHGLEGGATEGSQPGEPNRRLIEPPLPEALPEHNYRASSKATDPAP